MTDLLRRALRRLDTVTADVFASAFARSAGATWMWRAARSRRPRSERTGRHTHGVCRPVRVVARR